MKWTFSSKEIDGHPKIDYVQVIDGSTFALKGGAGSFFAAACVLACVRVCAPACWESWASPAP